MPRVSQAETWEQMASKLWGFCYPAELQRLRALNLREFIIFIGLADDAPGPFDSRAFAEAVAGREVRDARTT